MAQRVGHSADGVFVMIVDEDKSHANFARGMLSSLNFHVIVYSSPVNALVFLENNAQDVAVVLAAVDMKQLSGFQFLEAARVKRQDLQVIMMSAETTMSTMMRCVKLGARFLVKKPLNEETVGNLWQHVDLKVLKMEKIRELLQDPGQETVITISYEEQFSRETEADENNEEKEVNSFEAKKADSVKVQSDEKGHDNAKISNIAAAEGSDEKVSSGDGHVVPKVYNNVNVEESTGSNNTSGEQVSDKIKSDARVGVSLVDYPDSEDDETKKPTST
ncbi:two-component response regulator ORR29-like [Oryza glaberrima]|uniref:two-component response regulator ORR29-like n=1 Tax=Oryza glaberrima TaxID=4538 RepID=UPI00224C32E2|nr:two-component response regulator ORR29-like [Oryza glaberrima]